MATKKNITVNGVLTPVWQTDATAQQIDDAVVAAKNAVTYAAQSLTDAQKTQARGNIAAAPDGFGLGSVARFLSADDDLNTIGAAGWYWWTAPVPQNAPNNFSNCVMRVDCGEKTTGNYATQTVYFIGAKLGGKLRRYNVDNEWAPWEWVNPPMQLGVEYRTTERYLGKPVYVKAVDCGGLPSNSTKTVSFDPSYDGVNTVSTFRALSVWGVTSDCWTLPALTYGYGLDRSVNISGYYNAIIIGTTETGATSSTVTAVVKYIKTID